MLIKRDGVNFWCVKYCYITVIFCLLKLAKEIKFQFYFCWILNLHVKPFQRSKWICFYLMERSTNSVFLSCEERAFTPRERIVTSWSFSRGDRGRELFLQLPRRLTTSSNTIFRSSFGEDIGPITPRTNSVFVPIDFQICSPDDLKWPVPSPEKPALFMGEWTPKAFWDIPPTFCLLSP